MNKVTQKRRTNKQPARKAPKPGSTPVDRRLLAKAKREDGEAKPAAPDAIPYVRLYRGDYDNSIEQLEGCYRLILLALDGGEPCDALDALCELLKATECLKSVKVTSLTQDELRAEYEAERARILAGAA